MKRWEHIIATACDGGSHRGYGPEDFSAVLKRAEADGWELVIVVPSRDRYILFFKRPAGSEDARRQREEVGL